MPRRPTSRSRRRRARRWSRLRALFARVWPGPAQRRRAWRALRRTHPGVQWTAAATTAVMLWGTTNGIYQVLRKPTEIFFPVSDALYKTPSQTWSAYARLFRRHETEVISAELLAALAQVEGSGNPVVRTYWRWAWRSHPFELYRPASSAVGMYQITDGTFDRAKRYCVHDHVVVEEGPWYAWRSCWLNELYFRVVPSHAIELTSAFLDRSVSDTLARHRMVGATPAQKERLAAVIHLCGTGAGDRYARRGLALAPGARCGSHDPREYLERVEAMRSVFAALAQRDR